MKLDGENVYQPDLLIILKDHSGRIGKKNITGAPDLEIEVLSPINADKDRKIKLRHYAQSGVPETWILDPESQTSEIYRLLPEGRYARVETVSSGGILTTPMLPGLAVPSADLYS